MNKNFVEKWMGWNLEETLERIAQMGNRLEVQRMRSHIKRCEHLSLFSPDEIEAVKDSLELRLKALEERREQKAINKRVREEKEDLAKWSDTRWVNKEWRKLKKKKRRKKTSLKKDKEA